MNFSNAFTASLGIEHPIVMAPMFLVSNLEMMKAGMANGLMATFPSLNFRNAGQLEQVLDELNELKATGTSGSYGVNLIVQRTNPQYRRHLELCVAKKVPFFITSLGSPAEVIREAHAYGARVCCDVTTLAHAAKCYELGCDGFVAVGAGAGGHAGPNALHVLVPALKKKFPGKPVIAAGGIATGTQVAAMLVLGADAVSIGTRFIASSEASVSNEYKNAIVKSGMDDIVMTERLSGTPCAVINTPYVQKIGLNQNWLEKKLNSSSRLKKYFKMLVQFRGMKKLEESVKPGNYRNMWSAGQSVEMIENISSTARIVEDIMHEASEALSGR